GTTLTTNSGTDTSFGVTSVGSSLTSSAGGGVAHAGVRTLDLTRALSRSGNINLGLLTNDFVGAVTASGTNITLADANSLSASITALGVGDLNAVAGEIGRAACRVSDLTTNSGTSTRFGVTSVGGALSTVAGTDVGQTGTLTVAGTSSLTATAGDINLGTLTNDFVGAVTASGTNITLADANSLSASITALGVGDLNAVAG